MLRTLKALVPSLVLVGCGGTSTETTNGAIYQVALASGGISATVIAAGGFESPLDSVPSSDGSTFFFIASTTGGEPAVFSVPVPPGAPTVLASGAPLATPLGIAVSSDDQTVYVADPAVGLLQLPATGGTPTVVSGTACLKPRGLGVAREAGADQLYIATGPGACGGGAGLAKMAAAGGTVSFVAMGVPFAFPTGVAVAANGDVYVSNPGQDASGAGGIVEVTASGATEPFSGLDFGYPAGISLDLAGSLLLASCKDGGGHDQVNAITLATAAMATFNTTIGANTSGGGLHRAATKDVFSWADTTAHPDPPIIIK